jgi:cholesterol oxidase
VACRAEEEFDVVVVGSGFGGAVTACRLAERKPRVRVLVLERGQPYPPGSFARTPAQMQRAFWDPAEKLYGLFELWRFGDLDTLVSSGLGGGSLIYANVMIPKNEETFVQEDLAAGGRENWPISFEDLLPHYRAVRARQKPQRFPADVEPYASTGRTRAIEDAARALGFRANRPDLAVLFAPDRDEKPVPGAPVHDANLHHRPRTTCVLCGECDLGCNLGAKNTLDYTYLTDAQAAGAKLRTCCEVRTIEPLDDGKRGFRIGYRQHLVARAGHRTDLLDPVEEKDRAVSARRLILAAGAVGTPRLLLMNRAALPRMSPAVGKRISANGDALAIVRNADRHLDPSRGPVITASFRVGEGVSSTGRSYEVQDGGAPVLADWLWQSLELPKLPWRMRRTILREIRGKLLHRRDTNLSAELSELFAGRSSDLMPVLGHGRDIPNGSYVLDGDRLDLDWSSEPSEDYYRGLEDLFQDVAHTLGGKLVKSPWRRFNRSVTIHPLGGAVMADEPRHGVVDSWGKVFGYPRLYVADGAAMPGAVGVNPSFTIAAFADRVATGIVRELGPGE